MPSITSFAGETLLEDAALAEIKKQADLLLKQKDVALSWQAARHLKEQLSALPADKIKAILPEYRKISANLKALALPLLEKEEVFNLLEHNLAFLDEQYVPYLAAALPAWAAIQDNPEETKQQLKKVLDVGGPIGSRLKSAFDTPTAGPPNPIQPRQQQSEIAKNDWLFDEKERSELSEHARKVEEMGAPALALDGVGWLAEAIFLNSKPEIDKESFLRRARALITSRWRDVRTTAQLNEYLARPFAVGGLGLGGQNLDQASRLIEEKYQKLHGFTPVIKSPVPMSMPAPALAPTVPIPTLDEPKPAPASVLTEPASVPSPNIERIEPPDALAPAPPRLSLAQARNLAGSDKLRLEDVKSPPPALQARTVSTADELKLLTLSDFRGWGEPSAGAAEISRRIALLSKESLASKTQGIKRFRESELFKDYVKIGQQSLTAGKKLSEVLADQAANPNGLTEDEFFALSSLNGKLK